MIDGLKPYDYYLMVAEECGECVAAITKLLRKQAGRNYTEKTEADCFNAALEELVDVRVTLDQLIDFEGLVIEEDDDDYDTFVFPASVGWTEFAMAINQLGIVCMAMCCDKNSFEQLEKLCRRIVTYARAEKGLRDAINISESELNRRYAAKLSRWKERQEINKSKIPKLYRGIL